MEPDPMARRLRQLMGEMAASAPDPPVLTQTDRDQADRGGSAEHQRRRRPYLALATSAALLLTLVGVGAFALRSAQPSTAVATGETAEVAPASLGPTTVPLNEDSTTPGGAVSPDGSLLCPAGTLLVDTNNDGVIDICVTDADAVGFTCPPGFPAEVDTNADGLVDRCAPEPDVGGTGEGSLPCPSGFPYGVDTNGDGIIDTCYADPTQPVEFPLTCETGEALPETEAKVEAIVGAYNRKDADALIALIGNGPVLDPSLEPGAPGRYPSIGAWLEMAELVDDQIDYEGIGGDEPFRIIATRRNNILDANGIDSLSLTFELWLNQDCVTRVSTVGVVSQPDPCQFSDVFDVGAPSGCVGELDPRYDHAAVWTGDELLIYGGATGTQSDADVATGFAYGPKQQTIRDLPPSPLVIASWPELHALWTGDSMLVVGRTFDGEGSEIVVQTYSPVANSWRVSSPVPDDTATVGATVWTGDQLIMVGGELNRPDDRAWAYTPTTDVWELLPDPDIRDVEGMAGIWTGTEAIFIGGYGSGGVTQNIAYDPATRTWRDLTASPQRQWFQLHELFWTGDVALVASGHAGPGHPAALSIYDPATDLWTTSAPLPILPGEWLGADWTGTELILWGGYGTYGANDDDGDAVYGDGAAYDPATDTWRVLAESPLTDRCHPSGTWTGEAFVVFGGLEECGQPGVLAENDGALYDPAADTWSPLQPE